MHVIVHTWKGSAVFRVGLAQEEEGEGGKIVVRVKFLGGILGMVTPHLFCPWLFRICDINENPCNEEPRKSFINCRIVFVHFFDFSMGLPT